MVVKVFAALKEHFDPSFELIEEIKTVGELRSFLAAKQPPAEKLLTKCRFAVHGTFVDERFELTANLEILVMPPSSGG